MAKTAELRIRMTPALKQMAEKALEEMGLYPTQAITLFYTHLAMFRQLPDGLSLENATRQKRGKSSNLERQKNKKIDSRIAEGSSQS